MKERIAAKLAAVRDRDAVAAPVSTEPHYSPDTVAELWAISPDKVRRMFRNVPGVLRIGSAGTRRDKREYLSIRIPKSVLDRVHSELCR